MSWEVHGRQQGFLEPAHMHDESGPPPPGDPASQVSVCAGEVPHPAPLQATTAATDYVTDIGIEIPVEPVNMPSYCENAYSSRSEYASSVSELNLVSLMAGL
jgi:hypothetical protein